MGVLGGAGVGVLCFSIAGSPRWGGGFYIRASHNPPWLLTAWVVPALVLSDHEPRLARRHSDERSRKHSRAAYEPGRPDPVSGCSSRFVHSPPGRGNAVALCGPYSGEPRITSSAA